MPPMTNSDLRAPTLHALTELLRPLGYRNSSNLFSRPSVDVVHLIEVQGSRQSTSGNAKFTVNVGVFVPALVYADVSDITKPSIPLAHWRARLGSLSPEQVDMWWHASTLAQAQSAAEDVAGRVQLYALPALAGLQQAKLLANLWQGGLSPGLTETQRKELLARLESKPSSNASAA